MRSFIAIKLENRVTSAIKEIQQKLKKTNPNIKFVHPENIHLTLKFLGEISNKQTPTIKRALSLTAENFHMFKITLSKIGFFPNNSSPKILWIGIKNSKEINSLVEKLNSVLSKFGFDNENRPFKAHITIARIKNRNELNKSAVAAINEFNQEMFVDKITLLKSTLTKGGPVYEELYEINLKTI